MNMDQYQILEKLKIDLQLRGYSNGTVKDYGEMIKLFLAYFKKPAEELGEQEIREYLHYLRNDRNLSPSTVNSRNSAIRFFFEITLEKSLIYRRIPRLKDPIILPNILTKDEVEAIFNATENLKHKCILMTIYASGLRLSEVASLKISDIDSKNMRMFVQQGKGKKDRYVLLAHSNLEILRKYWKEYKPKYWLFEGREKGSRISTRAVQDAFKKNLKKAGIHKKASVHTVRHAFATHLLESGASIFYIRQLLGHSIIWTTTRYLHVATTDVLKTVSPLDTLMNNAKTKREDTESTSVRTEVPTNA
jgi:integrase/recombinase XerD